MENTPIDIYERPAFTWKSLEEERNALTGQERARLEQEKLGLEPQTIIETPELISRSLELMGNAIDRVEEREAYETALFIDPEHVESDEFRLAFLRADRFDVEKAAQRMINYWERKVELFGPEKAFNRLVSLSDLKQEDYGALVKGGFRCLPNLDESGRAIIFRYFLYYEQDIDTMLRVYWYIIHKTIFDPEAGRDTQKHGVIDLGGSGLEGRVHPFKSLADLKTYYHAFSRDGNSVLPVRCSALHVFPANIWTVFMIEQILGILSRDTRLRINVYNLLETEKNLEQLDQCGMPRGSVPRELGGELDFSYIEYLHDALYEELQSTGVNLDMEGWEEQIPELQGLLSLI